MPVRRKTRTVHIGDVGVGSEHPIRVQTMTTTDTKDVKATVEQVYKYTQSNHLLNSQFRFLVQLYWLRHGPSVGMILGKLKEKRLDL
jgi:hypothetical protein